MTVVVWSAGLKPNEANTYPAVGPSVVWLLQRHGSTEQKISWKLSASLNFCRSSFRFVCAKMSRKLKLQQTNIETQEQFDEVLAKSYEKLVVLDVYKTWSGPCEIIQPTFEYMLINIDDAVKLLEFVTIDQENVKKFFPSVEIVPDNHGCRPLFALVKDEQVQKVIEGCNAPLLLQTVASILDVEL